jgi:superfamily II DNA/RNA helicase
MYQRSFGGRSGGGRSPSKFGGGGRGRFRSGSSKQGGQRCPKFDISRLINKNVAPLEAPKEYVPQHQFSDFLIDERLKANIARKGYTKPTPIQDESIPHVLEGKDVVGIANTGTGKTAAFLVPFLNKVLHDRRQKVLILAPTRELALQIREEFIGFAAGFGLQCALCIGGASIGPQISVLRRNCNFIVGTPGRIKDLIQRRVINLSFFSNVVVDEADRMLDMGFIDDIRQLLAQLPAERHSLFFSATISKQVEDLIRTFMKDPIKISVKMGDTASSIHQDIIRVDSKKRLDVLQEMLCKKEFQKVLIFGRTKHGVEKLTMGLSAKGFRVDSIHGNKTQSRRQMALNNFKENRVQVLVATDVAARGLDITDVSHVINYDLPATYDDYVHRIGRTGRANKTGIALTFV